MIPLTGFNGHLLVHALGWTLVHFCWQGALVAGMLWCVLGLLGGRSSQARYCAACAAMLLMLLLPPITFGRIAAAEYTARNAAHRPSLVFETNVFAAAAPADAVAPLTVRIALALDHSMPGLLAVWLLGALFFVIRLNVGLFAANRMRRLDVEMPGDELKRRFDALRRRLGISRVVRLLQSARVQVPTVIGWLRPAVLIPASCMTGLSTEQVEAIFCHELAHVRRHDYLISVFQSVAEALLFYHPAVWWVSKHVRRERECCCDELAVANSGDRLEYARALSYLEERRAALPELLLGANGGVLTMRIKRLLGYRNDAGAPQFAALLLLALIAAIAGSYTATRMQAQKTTQPTISVAGTGIDTPAAIPGQATASASGGQQLHGSYKSWLTQDARWIINDQERTAYLRLANDNERDAFITEFWNRRDAPGAPEGSYREEYYARMAYSNEHFASDKRVGWSTDRGHVYLLYGKPQSIDSHPAGGAYRTQGGQVNLSYPFEVWHYASIPGVGDQVDVTFVDTCRCGEYNYTVDGSEAGATSLHPKGIGPAPRIFAPVSYLRQPPPSQNVQAAQSAGEISGVIVDPTGALVPRANVRTVNTDTGLTVALVTDNTGTYTFTSLPAGTYNVEVRASGFQRLFQENVKVGDSQRVALNMKLTVGAATQNLTVTGGPEVAKLAPPTPIVPSKAAPVGPLRVSSGTMAGNLIEKVDPVYPAQARTNHLEGIVVLHAIITKQGTIENVEAVSGPPPLIVSAVDAVRQWKYKPYLLNGEPTAVETTINVNYTFGEAASPFVWLMPGIIEANGQASSIGSPRNSQAHMADGATPPTVIHTSAPEYTEEARKAKLSGTVLLALTVDEQGMPQDVHVLRGIGHGLDAKAIEAVEQYRFKPAMKDGQPVQEKLNIEVNFKIF